MNIEDYRDYCLSLGDDVEERMPFRAFCYASEVLVFYVCGHMFSFFDCNNFSVVTLKCQPDRIEELKERHPCVIGVDPATASDVLLRELTLNSYNLVREKYHRKYKSRTLNQ